MKLSVVIPTYNRRRLLARTLPSLLAQDFPADAYEVVVVVDGATDGTAEYLRGLTPPCGLRVLEQPNRGPSAARNAGIAAATGEIVLLMDDDMRCDATLVRRHAAAHEGGPPDQVVFGPVLVAPESLPGLATDQVREWHDAYVARVRREGRPRSEYDVWVYANCSARRELLLAHGGFDEGYRWPTLDDAEFAIRLWRAGVDFRLAPDALAHTIYSKSASYLVHTDAGRVGASEVQLCRRHPAYRQHSLPANMLGRSRTKAALVRLACALPLSPEPALRLPYWLASRLRHVPPMRKLGYRLLDYRRGLVAMRGASREVGSWGAMREAFGTTLPVLLYHHVGPTRPGTLPELTVSPARFERQVRWLADHGFVGIRPADWLAWVREGRPLPDRPILITLDDAYADIAEFALPVLRRHGFGAAVYVVTRRIGGTIRWEGMTGAAAYPLMTAGQIEYWAGQGIEFGAHSRTHPRLTALHGDQLADEVEGSAEDLARLLGARPASFAYPHGAYNAEVRERVRQSFAMALSCEPGLNGLATDLSFMHRAEITPDDGMHDFACGARFGRLPVQYLRVYFPRRVASTLRRLRA